MKFKKPAIRIVFVFSILAFLYFFYKDLTSPEGLKGYYITQGYLFIILAIISFIISFFDKKIHTYFFIMLFSSVISLYLFESFIFYKGKIKFFMTSEEYERNDNRALQSEIKKKGGYIAISLRENYLISFSGISNSKIIFCNEDDFFSTYTSDRNGFNNPDYVWDEKILDVVVIGDSMTHGACVNEGNDIASYVRKISKLNAINLGWKRTGTLNQYARYLEFIDKKPRYIFWIYHESDLIELEEEMKNDLLLSYYENEEFRQNLKDKRTEIDFLIKKKHEDFMQTSFNTKKINKYKNFLDFLKLYKTRQLVLYKLSGIIKSNKKTYYPDDNKALNFYFNTIDKMKKITDENNTKLVLVYLPVIEYGFSKKVNRLNNIKQKIINKAEENNIGFIDIESSIKESFFVPGILYPKQHPGNHFNKLGYKFIAEKIVEFINEN
tara:strand:- start:1249 stop:2562 length:1314 start_codon:yes stop_codon:yes gene_type:complete